MLLPRGHRIVLEVDGKQHYATGSRADPTVYAATMHADRDLKLARYDEMIIEKMDSVYRRHVKG